MTAPTLPIPSPTHHARPARRVAIILTAFSFIVGIALLFNGWRLQQVNPLDHPGLSAMRLELRADPNNEALIDRYRKLDAHLRGQFFQSQRDYAVGAWLLLVGCLLALLAARRHLPEVRPPTSTELRTRITPLPADQAPAIGRALAGFGLTVAILALLLPIGSRNDLRELIAAHRALMAESGQADPASATGPETGIGDQSDLSYLRQWPGFRGPHGAGRAYEEAGITWPTQWQADTGRNVLWRTPVDLPGHNSPIVWGHRLFITGADERSRKVYAFDVRDGRLLWEHRVPVLPNGGTWPPEILPHTGFAAPTSATDGRLVFAIFANGDLVACDMQGRRVWAKALGEADNTYGYASSLKLHDGRLFVQWDHNDVNRLYALDPATGEEIWMVDHEAGHSWASPMVKRTAERWQLIVVTHNATMAYDPADGRPLWRWEGPSGDIASSAVADDTRVLVISPAWEMYALPTTESGLLDDEQVAWNFEDHLPEIAAPIILNGTAIVISDGGRVTGLDMADGRELWVHRLQGRFEASPVAAGRLLYVTNTDGRTSVLDVGGDEPKVVGTGELGASVRASAALVGGRIYMRSNDALYAIGEVGHE